MPIANILKFIFLFSLFLLVPLKISGQDVVSEETFKARVLEVLEERELVREDGSKAMQQNLKLKGLEGTWENKEFVFYGISDIEVISAGVYQKGDKVLVSHSKDQEGRDLFFVLDYVRTGKLFGLALIFAVVIIVIGKWKGVKALISLGVSFIVIMKFIVPSMLGNNNPVLIGVIGSLLILLFIIYITEGFNRKSNVAIFAVTICLLLTYLLSLFFTGITHLTGMDQEESMFLVSMGQGAINFKGLLLAGILIGTLGVLDDVVMSQIEAVEQIREANPNLAKSKVFSMAFKVGTTHLGAVVNTLFLAYAGVSLPLLLLFTLKGAPYVTVSQVINNEVIATEIVRTLVGSIGLALSVPIATFLGAYLVKAKDSKFKPNTLKFLGT